MSWDWQVDEDWADLPGHAGQYWVSTHGRVYQYKHKIKDHGLTEAVVNDRGYPQIAIRNRPNYGSYAMTGVHVLVAEAFRGPRPVGQVARHLDDVKTNVFVGNIAWGTVSQNAQDRVRNTPSVNHVPMKKPTRRNQMPTEKVPLAEVALELRKAAVQELQLAKQAQRSVRNSLTASPVDRAIAQANFYAAIKKAVQDNILTPSQIQEAVDLSRQRYYQITRRPSAAPTSTVQLPREDV